MKLLFVLCMILSFSSYSMTENAFKDEYNKIRKETDAKNNECLKQNSQIITKAVKEIENPKNKDEYVEFIKDEKEAISFIQNLDLKKIDATSDYKIQNFMIDNCTPENLKFYISQDKDRKYCAQEFDELAFMKGLIFATKNYDWSNKTKAMAKNKIFDYINHQASDDSISLVSRLIPFVLLELMVEYKLIDKNMQDEIKTANQKADQKMSELKEELKKDKNVSNDLYNCEAYKKFHLRELKFSSQARNDLQVLLKKISR